MKLLGKAAATAMAVPLALSTAVSAADFSPKMSFKLSPTKVKKNAKLIMKVSQDQGEEELGHVTLGIPAGFRLPSDAKVPNGDNLGSADLTIGAGPGCAGAGAGVAPATFPDRSIIEQDRSDEQADRGVKAVWVVDLRPVTTIALEVRGSVKKGWKLDGDIPANQFTCPPLVFDGTINPKSESGVPIVRNPKAPGRYTFKGTFHSQDSPTKKTIRQTVRIKR